MERLTKRISENIIELSSKANPIKYNGSPQRVHVKHPFWNVFDRLAEYEDLEELGLLLKLPCKVGDMVYLIFEKKVYQGNAVKVVSVRSRSHDFTRIEIVFEIEDPWYSDGRKMKHGANEILGERVFLTKEEAEEALRKKVD